MTYFFNTSYFIKQFHVTNSVSCFIKSSSFIKISSIESCKTTTFIFHKQTNETSRYLHSFFRFSSISKMLLANVLMYFIDGHLLLSWGCVRRCNKIFKTEIQQSCIKRNVKCRDYRQWRTQGEGSGGRNPPFETEPSLLKWSVHTVKCSTSCHFKTAVTEFVPHHAEAKQAGWYSGKQHCYRCRQGRIAWEMHSPTSYFQTCFWWTQFFHNFEPF